MKPYLLIAIPFLMINQLAALVVELPDSRVDWPVGYLQTLSLERFTTTRTKGIEVTRDSWEGIDLLPWLRKQTDYIWHELEFVSVDGHSLKLHRADLFSKPVWLALRNSQGWLEEGIRLVFPGLRDNIWIRGLDKIVLHGFTSLPLPRRLYSWEDVLLPGSASGIYPLSSLVTDFLGESQGDLLIVSKDCTPLRLRFPEHLREAQLVWKDGTLAIQPEALLLPGMPNLLIYIQMGHQALLTAEGVKLLPELARVLQWPESIGWKAVRPLYESYEPGNRIPVDGWLERD